MDRGDEHPPPRPDIFRLLDRVLVMSGTGRAGYSGPSAAAEAHFASLSVRAAKTGRRARGRLRAGHGTSKLGGGRGADDRRFRSFGRGARKRSARPRSDTRGGGGGRGHGPRGQRVSPRTAAAMTAGFEPLRRRNASAAEETYVAPFKTDSSALRASASKTRSAPFLLAVHSRRRSPRRWASALFFSAWGATRGAFRTAWAPCSSCCST